MRVTLGAGCPTFTRTLSVAVPPGPEQFTVYVVADVRLPVEFAPDVPLQLSGDTVHADASTELHEIVADVLYAITIGPSEPLALMSARGALAGWTSMRTVSVAVPPGPEQFTLSVVADVRFPVDCEPDVPVKPPGVTAQAVAFVEVHEIVAAVL